MGVAYSLLVKRRCSSISLVTGLPYIREASYATC